MQDAQGCSPCRFRDALSADAQGAFWDLVREREDGAVLALVRDRQSEHIMLAACTHLYHDPRFPDVKVAQAQLLCSQVLLLLLIVTALRAGAAPSPHPLMLFGLSNIQLLPALETYLSRHCSRRLWIFLGSRAAAAPTRRSCWEGTSTRWRRSTGATRSTRQASHAS